MRLHKQRGGSRNTAAASVAAAVRSGGGNGRIGEEYDEDFPSLDELVRRATVTTIGAESLAYVWILLSFAIITTALFVAGTIMVAASAYDGEKQAAADAAASDGRTMTAAQRQQQHANRANRMANLERYLDNVKTQLYDMRSNK